MMETTVRPELDERARTRFIGLTAGLIAGVLNAIVARVLMRVIALLIFGQGSFSVGGTAVIFVFGALAGPLFGLAYSRWFYRLRVPDLVKGFVFGLVMMVGFQIPVLFIFPDFRAELMAARPIGFGAFAAMNYSFMLTLAALVAWLEKRWPRDDSRRDIETTLTTIFGLLAVAGLLLLVVEIAGSLLGFMEF